MEATERAFVFLDGFNVELTILADNRSGLIPETLKKVDPRYYITRFAVHLL